jgi:predicted alpha/beta hydrolase family esterase
MLNTGGMAHQILVIHGGTSFDSYEDYLRFIKTRELTLEKLRQGDDWKASLTRELGEDYEVLLPRMPNGTNARYVEWRIWFERCATFLEDRAILVGHSLGGIFLAKYLSENTFSKRLKATLLVAAPFNDTDTVESLADFALPETLEQLGTQGGQVYLIYSTDDPVVPFIQAGEYQRALPKAEQLVFADRGHFNQPEFPELIALIRSL